MLLVLNVPWMVVCETDCWRSTRCGVSFQIKNKLISGSGAGLQLNRKIRSSLTAAGGKVPEVGNGFVLIRGKTFMFVWHLKLFSAVRRLQPSSSLSVWLPVSTHLSARTLQAVYSVGHVRRTACVVQLACHPSLHTIHPPDNLSSTWRERDI